MVDAYIAGRLAAPLKATATASVREGRYLVWSNEHKAWWGTDYCGYTRSIDRAGRYDRAEALKIAGMRDGGWRPEKRAILTKLRSLSRMRSISMPTSQPHKLPPP